MTNRTAPPQSAVLPIYKLPPVHEKRLSNGLLLVTVEDKRFPIVTARLGFSAGSKYDPPELPGLSETTAALLTEGTAGRTSRQIAEEVANIGGALHADSSADFLVVAASALSENLPKLLELTADVVRNAVFPEDEVALRKENRQQELAAQRSDAGYLADVKFTEVIFSPHPYAWQDPTPESIERLSRTVLADFKERLLIPNNAVLVLLGALPDRNELEDLVTSCFGEWEPGEIPTQHPQKSSEPRRSVVLVDRPGSVQTDLRIGRLAITRTDPDYFPLLVANTIFGGGASSRMFANIREKEGFAYDARSAVSPLKESGSFAAVTQVRNEVLVAAVEAVLGEMEQIAAHEVSAEELSTAQNYLSGVFVIRIETQDGLAGQVAAVKLLGLPIDYLERYTTRVRSVTPEQIRRAAARYISPEAASIVAVGDAAAIAGQLGKFGEVTVTKAGE